MKDNPNLRPLCLLFLFCFCLISAVSKSQDIDSTNLVDRHIEFKLYNNLYSQTSAFDADGTKVGNNERASFLTSILQFTFANEKKVHFGFDLFIRASRTDDEGSSPFRTFRFENNGDNAITAFTHLGPKAIWYPLNDRNLHLKVVYLFPLSNASSTGNTNLPFVDNSGNQIWVHLGYNWALSSTWYVYFEAVGVRRYNRRDLPAEDFFMPLKLFLSYYPQKAPLGIFMFSDYTPTLTDPTANFWQIGGGVKFYPFDGFEVELSGGKFVNGRNSGAGSTFNLGLSYNFDYPVYARN